MLSLSQIHNNCTSVNILGIPSTAFGTQQNHPEGQTSEDINAFVEIVQIKDLYGRSLQVLIFQFLFDVYFLRDRHSFSYNKMCIGFFNPNTSKYFLALVR